MRAAIYTRTNTSMTEVDVAVCRAVIDQRNGTPEAIFSDPPCSRAEFDKLTTLVEQGDVDVVVCAQLYSLVDWRDAIELVRDWHARGVRIIHTEGRFDTGELLDLTASIGTPEAELSADVLLLGHANYRSSNDPEFRATIEARVRRTYAKPHAA